MATYQPPIRWGRACESHSFHHEGQGSLAGQCSGSQESSLFDQARHARSSAVRTSPSVLPHTRAQTMFLPVARSSPAPVFLCHDGGRARRASSQVEPRRDVIVQRVNVPRGRACASPRKLVSVPATPRVLVVAWWAA